jgi:methylated-DNA-[protein]-cysteine S-methyltransferase
MSIYHTQSSPLGELLLVGEETEAGVALTSVSLPGQRNAPDIGADWQRAPGAFALVTRQLEEYFASERTHFDLDLAPSGTPFQQRIWQALDSVRYGTTITYGELAAQLGVPRDRIVALGAAVGANPLLIVRPCHRVIGADGTMRGYAGGVERKQWLLSHEGALQPMLEPLLAPDLS